MGTWIVAVETRDDMKLLEDNGYLLIPSGQYLIVQKTGTWLLPEALKGTVWTWGKSSMEITKRGIRGESKSDKVTVNLSRVEVPDWMLAQLKNLRLK